MKLRERWLGPANLDRAALRIDGWDTYALIAAVFLQLLLGLYTATDDPQLDEDAPFRRLQIIVYEAQLMFLTVAVLCTTYTMITFLLNKVYAVTALGRYKDLAYDVFQRTTAQQRITAFWANIVGMVSFLMAFSLNLYTKIKGVRGMVFSIGSLVLVGIIFREWSGVVILAEQLIFQG